MKPGKVRPIAICVFRREGRIFVSEGYDPAKKQVFYRPLGGKIEFGERGSDTVIREIHEELGLETTHIRYLGTLENIFIYNGERGHEIVLVYDGEFVNPEVYHLQQVIGIEDDNSQLKAVWKSLDEFEHQNHAAATPLYPDGLLELLRVSQ